MIISVTNSTITMIRFEHNGIVLPHVLDDKLVYCCEVASAGIVEIFFEPWGIKPMLRIDNHLLDYWNADVMQFDHMVQLQWDEEFYNKYWKRIMNAKVEYLNLKSQEDIDYFVGVNNLNPEIVEKIKKILHEKSFVN
jgi:hypothetical protein